SPELTDRGVAQTPGGANTAPHAAPLPGRRWNFDEVIPAATLPGRGHDATNLLRFDDPRLVPKPKFAARRAAVADGIFKGGPVVGAGEELKRRGDGSPDHEGGAVPGGAAAGFLKILQGGSEALAGGVEPRRVGRA